MTRIGNSSASQVKSPPTMAPTPVTAAYVVFNTTELLEEILSHFSTKELWKVRRVSKGWTSVSKGWTSVSKGWTSMIKGSSMFMRTMFLRPEPATSVLRWKKGPIERI